MKQVGWYNPEDHLFCSIEQREVPGVRISYSEPVFIHDDEPDTPSLLWTQAMNRLLVNQQVMMLALGQQGNNRQNLFEAHRRTDEIIALLKK